MFFVFFFPCFRMMQLKKMDIGVGGWCLAYLGFIRFLDFFQLDKTPQPGSFCSVCSPILILVLLLVAPWFSCAVTFTQQSLILLHYHHCTLLHSIDSPHFLLQIIVSPPPPPTLRHLVMSLSLPMVQCCVCATGSLLACF